VQIVSISKYYVLRDVISGILLYPLLEELIRSVIQFL
jgi:hypothetical protein